MKAISQIVANGGWKDAKTEKVKVKAWLALYAAIVLGSISLFGIGSAWVYAYVPAVLSLLMSVLLFVLEKPRYFEWTVHQDEYDLRNLYGVNSSNEIRHLRKQRENAFQGAEPKTRPNIDSAL